MLFDLYERLSKYQRRGTIFTTRLTLRVRMPYRWNLQVPSADHTRPSYGGKASAQKGMSDNSTLVFSVSMKK